MLVPEETSLAANLRAVQRRMSAAAERAGRDPACARLVAVTKAARVHDAAALVRLGVRDLAENRAEGLETKVQALAADGLAPRWHFVGHVQRNKARRIARLADVVHSVDSAQLLDTLDRVAGELGRALDVLVQVKLHPEPNKDGLDPALLPALLERARGLRHLRVVGLMAMAPIAVPEFERLDRARDVFARCAALAREHRALFDAEPELSLGMSGDFEAAIEAGATLVRVGSLLFEGLGEAA